MRKIGPQIIWRIPGLRTICFRMQKRKPEVVFLRGFPRSGTNWVCRILNLHPGIHCLGEFHFEHLASAFEHFKSTSGGKISGNEKIKKLMEDRFFEFVKTSIISFAKPSPVICDRTPTMVQKMIVPKSKYIIVSRDGRDAIVSWFYHVLRVGDKNVMSHYPEMKNKVALFAQNHNFFEEFPHQLLSCEGFFRERAFAWKDTILKDKAVYQKSVNGELDIKCIWIKYEDLYLNTEGIRYNLYEFLSQDPRMAKPLNELTKAGFHRHNPMSHNRMGRVGRWKKYFTPEQAKWFDEEAAEALEVVGIE